MKNSYPKNKLIKYDPTQKEAGGLKMRRIAAALLLVFSLTTISKASDIVLYSSSVINKALTATTNTDLDLNFYHVDALSVQVNYSSGTTQAVSFTDGNTSTMSITIASNASLSAAKASEKITISSNTVLSGAWLNVSAGGRTVLLLEGRDWAKQAVSSNTAISLKTALNNNFSDLFISTVQPGSNIIYSTAVVAGSAANAYTLNSSTVAALLVNAATFTSGQDSAYFTIGNARLTANTDWTVAALSSNTAVNIKNAILRTAPVLAVSTVGTTIVTATSTVVGYWTNFALVSSTPTALTMSGPAMAGGTDSNIIYGYQPGQSLFAPGIFSPGSNTLSSIAKATTGLGTGSALLLGKTAGNYPSPLVDKTTYYALNVLANSFQLSDTSTGALAGLTLTLSTSSLTGGGTFSLTPLALTGTPSFKLQTSNDGVNFFDLYLSTQPLVLPPYQASQSFPSTYTSSSVLWNIGNIYNKILRLVYTAATTGATNINYIVNGRRFSN